MPPDPPREVPPSAVALSVPEKNPTFSQNLNGSTDEGRYLASISIEILCFFCVCLNAAGMVMLSFQLYCRSPLLWLSHTIQS